MESLDQTEVKRIRRMSSAHIRGKLLDHLVVIDASADEVKEMPRPTLLTKMAELYLILREQTDNPLSSGESEVDSDHGLD